MRLKISKSKNAASLYVIKDITKNNKRTTKIVEKLGTLKELEEKLNGQDPIEWAKKYIDELNKKEDEQNRDVIVKYSQSKLIEKGTQRSFNGGYLFLQQLYHQLGLHKISNNISDRYKFTFNLDSILSRLIYGRILFPSSKLNTFQESKRLLEQPDFELQHSTTCHLDFNTSHVKVQPPTKIDRNRIMLNFNTSHVKVQREGCYGSC